MKKLFIGLGAFIINVSMNCSVFAQQDEDIYYLRMYNNSLSLAIGSSQQDKFLANAYGSTVLSEVNLSSSHRYLYQSQEYDQILGLYLFPYRIYDSGNKRFYETDPLSQYFSPYLFVGGDPINYFDPDGREGKPLVLYQEDHGYLESMNPATSDLRAAVPDAHYVPMSKFLNHEVGDLPEWNGNVFLKSHLGVTPGLEIMAENSSDKRLLTTRAREGVTEPMYYKYGSSHIVVADGQEFGRNLRRFSEERGVPIKKVVAGGCGGSEASSAIRKGFMEESKRIGFKNQKVKFKATHPGYNVKYIGKDSHESNGYDEYPKKTRYYVSPGDGDKPLPYVQKNGKRTFTGYKTKSGLFGRYKEDPFVEEEELNKMVTTGRIPRKISSFFEKVVEVY